MSETRYDFLEIGDIIHKGDEYALVYVEKGIFDIDWIKIEEGDKDIGKPRQEFHAEIRRARKKKIG